VRVLFGAFSAIGCATALGACAMVLDVDYVGNADSADAALARDSADAALAADSADAAPAADRCGVVALPADVDAAGAAPKVATLTETFDTLDPSKWTVWQEAGYRVAAISGQLEIDQASWTSEGWGAIDSVIAYDATESEVRVQLVDAGNAATQYATLAWIKLRPDSTNSVEIGVNNGQLHAKKELQGTGSSILTVPYSPRSMQWLRLREATGMTYWEYASAACGPWYRLYSESDPVLMTAVRLEIGAGAWPGAVGTVLFDNVNN
jgi:hypothetical protein